MAATVARSAFGGAGDSECPCSVRVPLSQVHTMRDERWADRAESCRYGHLRHSGSGKSGASPAERPRAARDAAGTEQPSSAPGICLVSVRSDGYPQIPEPSLWDLVVHAPGLV